MSRRNLPYDPPAGLEPELALLWAVVMQAQRDAAYQPRGPGASKPEVTPQDRAEAEQFLRELQAEVTA